MNQRLARFVVNSRIVLHTLSWTELYQLSLSMAAELVDRKVDAKDEAYALVAALLAHARREHEALHAEPDEPAENPSVDFTAALP